LKTNVHTLTGAVQQPGIPRQQVQDQRFHSLGEIGTGEHTGPWLSIVFDHFTGGGALAEQTTTGLAVSWSRT